MTQTFRRRVAALVLVAFAGACGGAGGGQVVSAPMGSADAARAGASGGTAKPSFQAPIVDYEDCVDICASCPNCPGECYPGLPVPGVTSTVGPPTPAPRNPLPELPYCAPERFQPIAAGGPRGRLWEELVIGRSIVLVTEIVGLLQGAVFDIDANRWTPFGPSALDIGPWRDAFLTSSAAPRFDVAGDYLLVEWSPVPTSAPQPGRSAPLPVRRAVLFDPRAGTWTPVPARPFTGNHVDVSTGALLLSFPRGQSGVDFASGARFDTRTHRWQTIAAAGAASTRTEATMNSVSGALFVWGGRALDARGNNSRMLDDGAVYRPATNSWTPVSTVGAPSPRGSAYSVVHGARVAVIGGGGVSVRNDTILDGALYSLPEDRWSPIAKLPAFTYSIGAQFSPFLLANDHLVAPTFPKPDVLDLRTNTWRNDEVRVRRGGRGLAVARPSGDIFYVTEYGAEKTPLLWNPASGALCYGPASAEGFHTNLSTPAGAFVWRRVVRRGHSECTRGEGWIVR